LLTRTGQAYYSTDGRKDWDGKTDVRPFRFELKTLKERLPLLASCDRFGKEKLIAIDKVVASDASGVGFGLVRVLCGKQKVHTPHEGPCSTFLSKRFFSPEERKLSSSMREILALKSAYAEGMLKEHGSILHLTDSAPVEAIMRIGSPIPELQAAAIAVHQACQENGLKLRVEWRSRNDARMVEADTASRLFDIDDFGCSEKDHTTVLEWAGFSLTFDLFASPKNAKCENFAVRFAEQGSTDWVNAFALDWGTLGEVFACPPPSLIIPAVRQIIDQKAKGVLLIPLWRSSRFWPVVAPNGDHFANVFTRFFVFSPRLNVGPEVISNTFRKRQPFVCLRFNGECERAEEENLEFLCCVNRGCDKCV
jgi:hypothetical protein